MGMLTADVRVKNQAFVEETLVKFGILTDAIGESPAT
jgi:hypothetical protein